VNTIFRVIELLPKSRFSSVLGVLRLLRFIRARNKNKIARKTALDVKRNFCCKRRFCRVKQRDDLPKISPCTTGNMNGDLFPMLTLIWRLPSPSVRTGYVTWSIRNVMVAGSVF